MASIYWQILQGIEAALTALVANTDLRRKLEVLETDTLPLCLLCSGPGPDKVLHKAFPKNVAWGYPVSVAYIASAAGTVRPAQAFFDTREAIRNALYTATATGLAQVWDFEIKPAEAIDLGPYTAGQCDVAVFTATYVSAELRT